MKFKIKVFIILFFCTSFVGSSKIYASTKAAGYGITVDSSVWEDCQTWKDDNREISVNANNNYNVGKITLISGVFKMKNRDNELTDFFLISYKAIVNPGYSRLKYNWFYNYYGWSENLIVESQLNESQKLTQYSPENKFSAEEYTVGVGLDIKKTGPEVSMNVGVTGTNKSLNIQFIGNSSNNYFAMQYDYLCDILHHPNYLTKESIQYGAYVVEHKKSEGSFSNSLTANMTFMVGVGHSNFLQTYLPPVQVSDSITINMQYNY